ncbi:MAG: hypothetical protein AB9866_11955 [Syntrophobacteraceae bacterium]
MANAVRLTELDSQWKPGMSSKAALDEAIEARDEFLKKHPELQTLQDEIHTILRKVIGSEDRMAVLGLLIEAKAYQLQDAVAKLRSTALGTDGPLDPITIKSAEEDSEREAKRRLH